MNECSNKDLMTQVDLEKHLNNDCIKINVECKLCENTFAKEDINNWEKHTCAANLKKKLEEEKEKCEKTQKELDEAKAAFEVEKEKTNEL